MLLPLRLGTLYRSAPLESTTEIRSPSDTLLPAGGDMLMIFPFGICSSKTDLATVMSKPSFSKVRSASFFVPPTTEGIAICAPGPKS
ncbi:unannotated protein [freshwater metagenome]|uniref:Unannotated protein n=1 Tax=freshwater metagenome TaxID=449393 RepID=A0A6J6CEJ1_9ZZZZ